MSYNLLSVGSNPKIDKSNKVSSKYWSVIMHLRPVNTKICPYQDIAKCKSACLNTAGLGGVYPSIQKARQRKTDLFLNDRTEFMKQLISDIQKFVRACDRKEKLPAIRLNGTSDIQWENIYVGNMEQYSLDTTDMSNVEVFNKKQLDLEAYKLWMSAE